MSDLSALRGHGLGLLLEQGFDFLKVALNRGRSRRGEVFNGACCFCRLGGKGLAKGVNFRRERKEGKYREGKILPVGFVRVEKKRALRRWVSRCSASVRVLLVGVQVPLEWRSVRMIL